MQGTRPTPVRHEWQIQWGERVREEREDRGWSVGELASRVDVNLTTIFRIERGDLNPNDGLKWRIAGVFKIRMDRLWAYPAIIPDYEGVAS